MTVQTASNATSASINPLRKAWAVVRADWRAYLILNAMYYGLVIVLMIYVAFFNPQLQEELLAAVGEAFGSGPLAGVAQAYGGGQVFSAMGLTFVVNLLAGSLLQITLPSLLIPFSGLLVGAYRAVLWGMLLSPANPALAGAMIPHSLVLLLEGQGYILALLAVYIHGRAILNPARYGKTTRRQGYVEGLRRTAWVYLLVALVLAVAAIYEAIEVIYLAPLFR